VHLTEVTRSIKSPIPCASEFPAKIAGYHDAIGSLMFALLVDGAAVDSWRGLQRGNDRLLAEVDKAVASGWPARARSRREQA